MDIKQVIMEQEKLVDKMYTDLEVETKVLDRLKSLDTESKPAAVYEVREEEMPIGDRKRDSKTLKTMKLFSDNRMKSYNADQLVRMFGFKKSAANHLLYVLCKDGYINRRKKGWYKYNDLEMSVVVEFINKP